MDLETRTPWSIPPLRKILISAALLFFSGCIAIPPSNEPTATSKPPEKKSLTSQYVFLDPTTQARIKLVLGDQAFSAQNAVENFTFSGSVSLLSNGLLLLERTASTSAKYPVGEKLIGLLAPGMALILVNTADFSHGLNSPLGSTVAVRFDLGYSEGDTCPPTPLSYNMLSASGPRLAVSQTSPSIFGTAQLTESDSLFSLNGSLWPLSSDANGSSTPLSLSNMSCIQGLLTNDLRPSGDKIVITNSGVGAMSLGMLGPSYTLLPQPASSANPVATGMTFRGLMQMPFPDPADALWKMHLIFMDGAASAAGTLVLSKQVMDPDTATTSSEAAPLAALSLGASGTAPAGLWDASSVSLPNGGGVLPLRMTSANLNGKALLAGFFQFDTNGNSVLTDASDWGFLLLYQQ